MIYLDNAASTPIHEDVMDAMQPFFGEQFGNPSSIHRHGRRARKAVETARRRVAALVGADPSEILFTSGGTESDTAAITGVVSRRIREAGGGGPCQIIVSSVEHDAVLEPCRRLEEAGHAVEYLPVDRHGTVDPSELERRISGGGGNTATLVSVMLANNEVGTIQPVRALADICRAHGVPFHTDAVQAVGKIPVDVGDLGVDLLSISSHKINGPKGVGALYVRRGLSLDPVVLGGGQERGMRSGTENVPGIVGLGKACEIAGDAMEADAARVSALRDDLVRRVTGSIPKTVVNGNPSSRLPGTAHFTFLGVSGEDLIIKLDEHGIAASTGSACSVNTQKASHVLQAMGFSHEEITGSLRLAVGTFNTRDEIDRTVGVLAEVVRELRAVSPFREKYSL